MAALTTILLATAIGVGAAGAYTQYQGAKKAADAQEQAQEIQQQQYREQQQLQQQQATLDAERRTRQIIREQVAARSQALASTTASGAQFGSGLAGAYGGIEGQTNTNLVGLNQNKELGDTMFADNMSSSNSLVGAFRNVAAGQSMAYLGAGMTSLGNLYLNNAGTFNRVGTYFGSKFA